MSKFLRTQVMDAMSHKLATFLPHPSGSAPHAKGVRYFRISNPAIEAIYGAMDIVKQGQKCKKRIVVRPSRHYQGLHELYTYRFPKQWSKACQANRELIKTAQRLAHAIEKDRSFAATEWRIRHIQHLLNPVPGQKIYAHFYTFVYVSIYQSLRTASQRIVSLSASPSDSSEYVPTQHIVSLPKPASPAPASEYVSFVPITPHILPLHRRRLSIRAA